MKAFTFVLFTNTYNPHMLALADELFALLGNNFVFLSHEKEVNNERKKLGWTSRTAPYVSYYSDNVVANQALIDNADIVYFGANPNLFSCIQNRIYQGKITYFHMERILKHGIVQTLIPKYRKYFIEQRIKPSKLSNVYFLACSSYLKEDLERIGANTLRTYVFGYFPVFTDLNAKEVLSNKSSNSRGQFVFLTGGRMLNWKHFDDVIRAFAAMLKNIECRKYPTDCILKIAGNGKQESSLRRLVNKLCLSEYVEFLGSLSPELMRDEMINADVFIASSDKREGWGVVVNESMNSCCAVIATKEMGSVPFLIANNRNGLIFKSGDIKDLSKKMSRLFFDRDFKHEISLNAYKTIDRLWNPGVAANRLVSFSWQLLSGNPITYDFGPLSKQGKTDDKLY